MDELSQIKRLAGIQQFAGYTAVGQENISHTGSEKQRIEKELKIRPGDKEWFELWFSRPYWLGFPAKFRGLRK